MIMISWSNSNFVIFQEFSPSKHWIQLCFNNLKSIHASKYEKISANCKFFIFQYLIKLRSRFWLCFVSICVATYFCFKLQKMKIEIICSAQNTKKVMFLFKLFVKICKSVDKFHFSWKKGKIPKGQRFHLSKETAKTLQILPFGFKLSKETKCSPFSGWIFCL